MGQVNDLCRVCISLFSLEPGPTLLALTHRALQEAQEIFGVDFDYDEFEKYNEYDEELEEEYEYEDDEAEGEIRVRPKKTTKKRVSRRSIFEMYEPSELESSHLTDQDNDIRATDLPERFQVRNHQPLFWTEGVVAEKQSSNREWFKLSLNLIWLVDTRSPALRGGKIDSCAAYGSSNSTLSWAK